jgi:uncharacterized protein (TIGR01244 family)
MAGKTFTLFLAIVFVTTTTLAQKGKYAVSEPVMINQSYSLYQAGDIFLAGQPTEENLDSLIKAGVILVVNLRTKDEMIHLSFDEAKHLKSSGVKYIHIPIGGPEDYKPEVIEKMGKKMKSVDGKVLIHCRGAGRATYAWMAWLVNFENYSIDEAVVLGSKARFYVPFFDLLGYPITIEKK